MGILQTVPRRHIKFNAADEKHRAAYWLLRSTGKQDSELRFVVEEGFTSIITMMQVRIADHFSMPVPPEALRLTKRNADKVA